jgi:hypothetical protein
VSSKKARGGINFVENQCDSCEAFQGLLNMLFLLLLFIQCLFQISLASRSKDPSAEKDYCGPWIVVNVSTLPQAQPSIFIDINYVIFSDVLGDVIEVHYLAAPILYVALFHSSVLPNFSSYCSYLDRLTWLDGYHGGLGFVNKYTEYLI